MDVTWNYWNKIQGCLIITLKNQDNLRVGGGAVGGVGVTATETYQAFTTVLLLIFRCSYM